MSSRGSAILNGHITASEYETVDTVFDAEVLEGKTKGQHGLPDYSRKPNSIYIKLKPDGTFHEMRKYNEINMSVLEIAYHPEPNITGNRHDNILHYHTIDSNFNRSEAKQFSTGDAMKIYNDYKKYLEVFKL